MKLIPLYLSLLLALTFAVVVLVVTVTPVGQVIRIIVVLADVMFDVCSSSGNE